MRSMPPLRQLAGKRFGRLTVLSRAPDANEAAVRWLCRCDCGTSHIVGSKSLANGHTRSCGCLHRETRFSRLRHGGTLGGRYTREYSAWLAAKGRCFNPRLESYPRYGGRGITMSEEWRTNFSAFLRDLGPCPEGHTLDRIDVNGHYAPGNCRWALPIVQQNNMRTNRLICVRGETMTLAQASRRFGVKVTTMLARLDVGLPITSVVDPHLHHSGPRRYDPTRQKQRAQTFIS